MLKEADKFKDSGIIEGMVSLKALISARENATNDRAIYKVLFDSAKIDKKSRDLSFIKHKSVSHGFILELTDSKTIDSYTIGNSHGGVIAFCGDRSFNLPLPSDIIPNGFYVFIEGIEDPYNFGYALRSLYAAGVDGIILSRRNWMSAVGVVCRASAGASELFPMFICDSPADSLSLFKNLGFKIVCADIDNSVSVYDSNLKLPLFLIIGGEKRGISRSVLDSADLIVRLDYGRSFPAALSAASAASLLAFEVFRQNREIRGTRGYALS